MSSVGSITQHIDLVESALVLFFLGFGAAILWLRRLDKREGYPMRASPFGSKTLLGFPLPLEPKIYLRNEGGTTTAPHYYEPPPVSAVAVDRFDGTAFAPVGNPLLAGLGPGAWVMRRDEPMRTEKGELMLQPLRLLDDWSLEPSDADPRGMKVMDRRWFEIGVVRDVWIDRSTHLLRLFEVDLLPTLASRRVLVPIFHSDIRERDRELRVTALEAHQFADLPMPASPVEITAREDDRLNAYYAAGHFYRDTEATFRPEGFSP